MLTEADKRAAFDAVMEALLNVYYGLPPGGVSPEEDCRLFATAALNALRGAGFRIVPER